MDKLVTITSQGKVTIPKSLREEFGIQGVTKATINKVKAGNLVRPKKDFWSLSGKLVSS
jgi:AbrB family looped-hinge helix DNA binding protein